MAKSALSLSMKRRRVPLRDSMLVFWQGFLRRRQQRRVGGRQEWSCAAWPAGENDRVPVTVLFPTGLGCAPGRVMAGLTVTCPLPTEKHAREANKEVDELNETELAKLSDKCGVCQCHSWPI